MRYDANALEQSAWALMEQGRYADALKLYFYMADGDPSLGAGWVAWRIALCYEALGDLYAARYWHGRAVEENPGIRLESEAARQRLAELPIDEFIIVKDTGLPPAYLRKD